MTRPPSELTEHGATSEKVKSLIQNVRRITGGIIFVYQWNSDKDGPVGLFISPGKVQSFYDALEDLGAAKKVLIHNGSQFDLSMVTGFSGSHLEIFSTGKMNVQWARNKKGPDFIASAFLDLLEIVAGKLNDNANNNNNSNETTANNRNKNNNNNNNN